jgi:hypothetical protein
VHLGIAEKIGAVPDVVGARRIGAFVASGMLLPSIIAIATVWGFWRWIPRASCVGRSGPLLADRAASRRVPRVERVLGIVGKGVTRH